MYTSKHFFRLPFVPLVFAFLVTFALVGCGNSHALVLNSSNGNNLTSENSITTTASNVIQQYYSKNHRKIVGTYFYPEYHAEIVESSIDPTIASTFDWWDMNTEQHETLAGPPNYMNIDKVVSQNEVVFLASGAYSESPGISFPFYIVAKRLNAISPWTDTHVPAYFPIQKTVTFGDGKVEALSQLSLTSDGITMGFSPLKSESQGAYAPAAYLAPTTNVTAVPSSGELVITLMKTTLSVGHKQLLGMQNPFVQSVTVQPKGRDVQVILHLSNQTKFYTGMIDHMSSTPTLTLQFASTNETQYIHNIVITKS